MTPISTPDVGGELVPAVRQRCADVGAARRRGRAELGWRRGRGRQRRSRELPPLRIARNANRVFGATAGISPAFSVASTGRLLRRGVRALPRLGGGPLRHHHLAAEVADLFAPLVVAPGLDRSRCRGRACSSTRPCRAPWSRRRSCRRGRSASCAGASRPRGSRSPRRSRRGPTCRARASTRGCRRRRSCRTASASRAYHASVWSGWWFIVIMQNR